MKLFKEIVKQIKKYDNIVIARHIGADPDALGSQFALKEIIEHNYKNKKVYAVGAIASKFRFMGNTDKTDGLNYQDALLIVLDTPDKKRIDGIEDVTKFADVIKIDHHPFIETFREDSIEYIETDSSSTSQLIFKLVIESKLKLTTKAAENIYIGIVGDTDRFLHDYTSKETFRLVTELLDKTNIDFTKLYEPLYTRPLAEVRFQGYIYQNLKLTDNNVAYIKLTDDVLKKFEVDSASAGNMINDLKFVQEIIFYHSVNNPPFSHKIFEKSQKALLNNFFQNTFIKNFSFFEVLFRLDVSVCFFNQVLTRAEINTQEAGTQNKIELKSSTNEKK